MITRDIIFNEIRRLLLAALITMSPFILYVMIIFVSALYTPSMITGTVQITTMEDTDEPYQIVLRGKGNNILGNKDFVIMRIFDTRDEVICERENITDGDKVVFNYKGIMQYKIEE